MNSGIVTPSSRRALGLLTAVVLAFLYAPIVILIVFSFNRSRQTAVWEGFTLDWYATLLRHEEMGDAVVNSLIVAAATTVSSLVIGVPAGMALASGRSRLLGPTRGLVHLPLVIPEIVLGVALVTFMGVIGLQLGVWSVIAAHVVFCVSYVAIVVRARLADVDGSLEEAAADLGAPPAAVFIRVTLPTMLPGVIAAALLVFTLSLDDYVVTSFVAGAGATTLPLKIYSMLKTGVTPEVNAVSSLLLIVTIAMIVAAQWLLRRPGTRSSA